MHLNKNMTNGVAEERPAWLTRPAPDEKLLEKMKALLEQGRLHTVCESADCPNVGQCFAEKTCTFMILGNTCTRNCRFCAVQHGQAEEIDAGEPFAVASTAEYLGLKHVVITSVTRDDLCDGGAAHFAATIRAVRDAVPQATVEVLIPDFQGDMAALEKVLEAGPDVINHNTETVPRLYPRVRPQAKYQRSLQLIERVWKSGTGIVTKSGLMMGLGEKTDEVIDVLQDLRDVGCQMLTLGQYLRPSPSHLPIVQYIHPDIFRMLADKAYQMGFSQATAGPLVRSSFHAAGCFAEATTNHISI